MRRCLYFEISREGRDESKVVYRKPREAANHGSDKSGIADYPNRVSGLLISVVFELVIWRGLTSLFDGKTHDPEIY